MSLLEVSNLRFSIDKRFLLWKRRKEILRSVSFSLDAGSTLGLIGESGGGKTTIAKCLAGIYEPCGGTINFRGLNLYPETKSRKTLGPKIQLLFQNHAASLDPRLTVRESLVEGVPDKDDRLIEETITKFISMVGLPEDALLRYPHQLSGGQRQRVALARALSVSPQLLILDEPTSALDSLTQIQILKMVVALQKQTAMAILYISHDILTSSLVCDSIAVLHEGVIVEQAATRTLLQQPQHPYTRRILQATLLQTPPRNNH